MLRQFSSFSAFSLLLLGTLPARVLADKILETTSFSTCDSDATIKVNKVDIQYNADNKTVTFNVAGSSTKSQNVTVRTLMLPSILQHRQKLINHPRHH